MQKNKLEFSLHTAGSLNKKEPGFVFIEARNSSHLPVVKLIALIKFRNQLTGEQHEETIDFSLNVRASDKPFVEVNYHYCGNIDVHLERVTIYDFLGLFSRVIKPNVNSEIYIMPSSFSMEIETEELMMQYSPETPEIALKKGMTGQEIFDVKEYAPGDNVRHMHWNLTSKFDALIMKEFTESIEQSYLILLESSLFRKNEKDTPGQTDAMMETLLSVSKAMLQHDNAHTIAWFNHEAKEFQMEEISSYDHLITKLRILLKLEKHQSQQSTLEEYILLKESLSFSHVVYITTERSAGFLNQTSIPSEITVLNCSNKNGTGDVVFTPENVKDELSRLTI